MDDETSTTTTTGSAGETTTTVDNGSAGGKTFTQADVDAIVGKRLAEERKRSAAPASKPTTTDDSDSRLTLKQLQAELAETKLRGVFDKRAAKLNLDDDTADELFELFRVKPPENPAEWFEKKSKLFGLAKTTPPASTTAPKEPAKSAAAAATAPQTVDKMSSGGLVNLWKLSADELAQLGPQGARKAFEDIKRTARAGNGAPPLPRGLPKRP